MAKHKSRNRPQPQGQRQQQGTARRGGVAPATASSARVGLDAEKVQVAIAQKMLRDVADMHKDGKLPENFSLTMNFNIQNNPAAPVPEAPKTRMGKVWAGTKKVLKGKAVAAFTAAAFFATGTFYNTDNALAGYDAQTRGAVAEANLAVAGKIAESRFGPVAGVIVEEGGKIVTAILGGNSSQPPAQPGAERQPLGRTAEVTAPAVQRPAPNAGPTP